MSAFAFLDTYPEADDFFVDGSESEQPHFDVDSYSIPLLYADIHLDGSSPASRP